MPSKCFICNNGSAKSRSKGEKFHCFSVPRKNNEILKKWEDFCNTKHQKLTPKCVVCSKHFEDEFVIKESTFLINGTVEAIPRKVWKLKDGAVPTIYDPEKPTKCKTKSPEDRQCVPLLKRKPMHVPEHHYSKPAGSEEVPTFRILEVQLPNAELPLSQVELPGIDTSACRSEPRICEPPLVPVSTGSKQPTVNLQSFLNPQCTLNPQLNTLVSPENNAHIWREKELKRKHRSLSRRASQTKKQLAKTANLNREKDVIISQLKTRIKVLERQVRTLESKTNKNVPGVFVPFENLMENQQQWALALAARGKTKSNRGIRYSADFLMYCKNLASNERQLYGQLNKDGVLPVPTMRYLRRLRMSENGTELPGELLDEFPSELPCELQDELLHELQSVSVDTGCNTVTQREEITAVATIL